MIIDLAAFAETARVEQVREGDQPDEVSERKTCQGVGNSTNIADYDREYNDRVHNRDEGSAAPGTHPPTLLYFTVLYFRVDD